MNECSLLYVNNPTCHNAIKNGTCPGLSMRQCVNETALTALDRRYEEHVAKQLAELRNTERERAMLWVSGHYVEQDDPAGVPPKKDLRITKRNITHIMLIALKQARKEGR